MEMGGSTPFEHLELLAHEIFLPILSNAQNQARWGEVPTREIMDRFYGFLSSTTILCGQIKGETRLPMPPMDIGGASSGKNRISLLEGAIITWTKQIKSVLKQDPESQLKQGMHPTPDVEIDFWKNKVRTCCVDLQLSRMTSDSSIHVVLYSTRPSLAFLPILESSTCSEAERRANYSVRFDHPPAYIEMYHEWTRLSYGSSIFLRVSPDNHSRLWMTRTTCVVFIERL